MSLRPEQFIYLTALRRLVSTLALFSLCLTCLSFGQQVWAAQPISLQAYDSQLATLQYDLSDAASGQTASRSKLISDSESIKSCVVLEQLPSGEQSELHIDNRPLAGEIESAATSGRESDLHDLSLSVGSIRSSLPSSQPASLNTDPQQSVSTVLSGVAFSSAPVEPESPWDRFVDWVVKAFGKIHWPHFGGPVMPSVSPVFPETILITVLVGAVVLLAYVIYQIWRNRSARLARLATQSDSMLAINAEERELVATHNYTRLRQLAAEAADSGDFRAAFRLTFLALLVFLDAEGAIKLNRSRTNWEYLRGLASRQELAAQLRPLVRDFDRIWYGEEIAIEADYAQASSVYESIQASILGESVATSSPVAEVH